MSVSNGDYSQVELEAIHRAIAPPPPPAPSEVLATMEVPVPEWMRPFWKLVDLEPELFIRLATDPWVETLSHYAFFPPVLEWRSQGRPVPGLRMTGRTRGPVAILRSGDEHLAIKPFQNSREDAIARIAASAGAGPEQLASLPGYLAEQFAEGVFFTDLTQERREPDTMRSVGLQLGGMLRRLHEAGVLLQRRHPSPIPRAAPISSLLTMAVAPSSISAFRCCWTGIPSTRGRKSTISPAPCPCTAYSQEWPTTAPKSTTFCGSTEGRWLRSADRTSLARDLKFAQQGLSIAAQRLGQHIIAPLRDGFLEAYRPAA